MPWLAPGRLLVFIKYKPLVNDSFNVSGEIDGVSLLVREHEGGRGASVS